MTSGLRFRGHASLVVLLLVVAGTTAQAQFNRTLTAGGTTSFQAAPAAADTGGIATPEFPNAFGDEAGAQQDFGNPAAFVNRSLSSGHTAQGVSVNAGKKAKSNPELVLSFNGLNHRNQRLANGGNQFSVEPPDQGLCAGNGYVMESVNDVLRVYDTSGNALIGVVDLNTFYGYIPAINRTTGVRGPFVTDPSCYYDPDTGHWFQVVLTLDSLPNGAFTGTNHIDIAVSNSSNPTGSWTIYRMPVQDDGTQGTPNHSCDQGPCLGDYPHIGADANGFYVTTNEYPFFGDGFHAAQVYAFSKAALAARAPVVTVTQFDTIGAVAGNPGFTLWPATSPNSQYSTDAGGTEYFLSSNAADEANGTGTSSQLVTWAITNTQSLNTATPAVSLSNTVLSVGTYGIPPKANQKPGDFPLGQCLNNTACATFVLGVPDPFAPEVESHLDANDTRMQQVVFANGKLWGALDTAVTLAGGNKAGIEWFIVKPTTIGGLKAKVALQGYLALDNNNLTYPAVGITNSGRGIIAFTVVGSDYYPSSGYAPIDAIVGAGDVHIAADGLGPSDGFTSYKAFVGDPPRTRWGDYSATVTDGSNVWMATEFIAQTCTLSQYVSAPFGSCGGTRTSLANWGTRISKIAF